MKKSKEEKMNNFSVGLGLFDYINPILYGITVITIAGHMRGVMAPAVFWLFVLGAALSLVFGLAIPTVKFIVGLGLMQFKMPVNLVFFVNSGILLSGLMLFYTVIAPKPLLFALLLLAVLTVLALICRKTKKFNTVAVLTGAAGYLMIYATMIRYCLQNGRLASVALYAFAICLFVFLCLVGIRADLKDARVHWVIEISNVVCQASVAIATLLAF